MTPQSETHDAASDGGQSDGGGSDGGRSALWIRALSRLPFGVLYRLTAAIMWLLRTVLRFRVDVARDNLRRCFPDRTEAEIDSLLDQYYRQLAQVAAEFIKMADMSADQLRAHLQVQNVERVDAETRAGRSVLLLGAHQCNWEWTLQATVLYLGVPINAAYKPLHAAGFDRELRKLRCRYGAHLIAAKRLVREVVRRRGQLHAVALHADQMPSSSGRRQWLSFPRPRYRFLSGAGRNRPLDRLCRLLRADAPPEPRPVPGGFSADLRGRRAARSGSVYRPLREPGRADDPGKSGRLDLGAPALESRAPRRTARAATRVELNGLGTPRAWRGRRAGSGPRDAATRAIPPVMEAVGPTWCMSALNCCAAWRAPWAMRRPASAERCLTATPKWRALLRMVATLEPAAP
jgi:KDO2-lipid IV(A) lauroyltransferase